MLAYCSTIGTAFNSQKWFTLDPCGIGCVVFSYFFHLYGLFNIHQTLISHSPIATFIFYALYCPCTLLALSNLFMAQHTDPGAIPLGARPLRVYEDEEDHKSESDSVASSLLDGIDVSNVTRVNRKKGVRRCRKCRNNYKPPRAHHDSVTGRCISKFDHFCPWVGNAVGALNHKFFVLFIFYTFLNSGISLVLIVMRFVRCGYTTSLEGDASVGVDGTTTTDGTRWNETVSNATSSDDGIDGTGLRFLEDGGDRTYMYEGCLELYSMRLVGLMVISICFLVFTCCMLFEQVDAIESNTSKIARMKMRMGQDDGEYGKVALGFNEMFGVGSVGGIGGRGAHVGLHCFLPTPVRFPNNRERDQVLGFEYCGEWAGSIYEEKDEETASTLGHLNTNGRGRTSGSLMVSDDDLVDGNGVVEIELPAGNGSRLERSNSRSGTISQRSSSKLDTDSSSEQSARIV